jgi:arylsulfatase A-like enzyme
MRSDRLEPEGRCVGRTRTAVRRALWLVVACVPLLAGCGEEASDAFDTRTVGTLEDVAGLADRDDLNVIFVLIDTLRADRMGSYGYERATTPVLDYFAATGLRFAEHRAQSSWTKTSMASLWTGLYPQRTDVLNYADTLAPAATLPAEVFERAGFKTAGIWRNGWVAPNFGFNQGFDYYITPSARLAPSALRQKAVAGRIDGTDIDAIYTAIEFLRANRDQRFFLYMHLMDVHQYISTEDTAIFGNTYSDAYDNAVRWTDEQLGQLMAELFRLSLAEKTLVVFASDHGEAFGEHGSEGHARDVHYEVVVTPFILSFPFKLTPGIVVPEPTENIDVWPTILELVGLESLPEADGKSRAGWLIGDRTAEAAPVGISHLDRSWGQPKLDPNPIIGVQEGPYRLIHDAGDPTKDRLYNVEKDRLERVDMARDGGDTLAKLQDRAKLYLQGKTPWEGGAPEIELDDLHLRQLRALGYSIEE